MKMRDIFEARPEFDRISRTDVHREALGELRSAASTILQEELLHICSQEKSGYSKIVLLPTYIIYIYIISLTCGIPSDD